jgi:LPXTG-motif cell wall-anchored protein
MARTNEGGSVLVFVVVGVILAGLLVGGIYLVNRQTSQPRPQAPVAQKPQEKEQGPPPAEPGNSQSPPSSAQPGPDTSTANNGNVELPTTGPKETIGSLVVLGLLSGALAGYVRSRRPQLSL